MAEKTEEQKQQEKLRNAIAERDGINHFQMKLGQIPNDLQIESQLESLSNYNDIPSKEEITKGKIDSYRQDFMNSLFEQYFKDFPETREKLGEKKNRQ